MVYGKKKAKNEIKVIEHADKEEKVKILNNINNYFANMGLNINKKFNTEVTKFVAPIKNTFKFEKVEKN